MWQTESGREQELQMAKCVQCGRQMPPLSLGRKVCQWCRQYEAAQRGEDQEYQPVIRQPWARQRSHDPLVMYVILGINLAVFIGMALAGVSPMSPSGEQLVHWGANFGPYTFSGQYWRLLTYMFVHVGIIHIAFNMWCLWDLGTLAESLYGRFSFVSIYLVTGVAAGVASLWWHPRSPSAGASGAIFGVAGALIASFKLGEFSLPRAAIQGVTRSLVIFAVYNLIFGAAFAGIDNAAHVGGFVTGLALGAAIAKLAPFSPVRRFSVIVLVALVVLGAGALLFRSQSYMAHAVRAEQLEQSGNHTEAISQLIQALAAKPDDAHARYMLGLTYARNGQFADAEREFKNLAQRQPQSSLAHYELGLVYLNMDRPADAEREFNQVLASDDRSAEAHVGLGLALAQQNRDAAAVNEYKTALAADPDISHGYYHLGQSYMRLKQYDDAIVALKTAAEKDVNDGDTQIALSRAYAAKGMNQEAADAMAKAQSLQNNR
jgi:membrane associated rhomboid family serine protease/Flp pilus assembly protein TadD